MACAPVRSIIPSLKARGLSLRTGAQTMLCLSHKQGIYETLTVLYIFFVTNGCCNVTQPTALGSF